MSVPKNKVLVINGVNTHLKGSGYYALCHWLESLNKSQIDYTLFHTVPGVISNKKNYFYKILLFFYFIPGSLLRFIPVPLFEILYKISVPVILKIIYFLINKNYKSVIFSHHCTFYLIFFVSKIKRILIIHDLIYIRSKSYKLPRWLIKITFAIELKIYKQCKSIYVLSCSEYRILRKFLDVRVCLLSISDLSPNLTPSKGKIIPNNQLALVSDWRRFENREGAISFFRYQKINSNSKIKIYVYGYGSTLLVSKLNEVVDTGILFVDKGTYEEYSQIIPSAILVCIEKGGGIKLKVLEAIRHKKFVFGTRAAFIGIPKKMLSNISLEIEKITDCIDYFNKYSLSENSFYDFFENYSDLYLDIGRMIREEVII